MKNKMKDNNAITLIALVITIIVLLILAGVSIAMLTGENGLLTKAQTASDQTKQKGAIEKVKLAVAGSWGNDGKINIEELKSNLNNVEGIDKSTIKDILPMTVKVDGTEVKIESNGKVEKLASLPSTDNTKPYLPSGDFTQVEGTNLDNGLTIKDKDGNSYVWVEVPKTIFTTATSETDYANIETDMQTYAVDYREYGYSDTWYNGCGLTEIEYNYLKERMLKSVYANGGFWIGQYETGIENNNRSYSDDHYIEYPTEEIAVVKEGAYVYNWVRVGQAQQLADKMNSGNCSSSLLFGIQWDLTLKFIEAKGAKTQNQLKTDSTAWGNYFVTTFDLQKGKYSEDFGKTYKDVYGIYSKPESAVFLTTGATVRNSALNIYDLAGNVSEWTLEKEFKSLTYAGARGGYVNGGGEKPVSCRMGLYDATNISIYYVSFRVAIY